MKELSSSKEMKQENLYKIVLHAKVTSDLWYFKVSLHINFLFSEATRLF